MKKQESIRVTINQVARALSAMSARNKRDYTMAHVRLAKKAILCGDMEQIPTGLLDELRFPRKSVEANAGNYYNGKSAAKCLRMWCRQKRGRMTALIPITGYTRGQFDAWVNGRNICESIWADLINADCRLDDAFISESSKAELSGNTGGLESKLLGLGFKRLPYLTITNILTYELGRGRHISIGDVGTIGEVMYLCSKDLGLTEITDLVCIHNYDYDGSLTIERVKAFIDWFFVKGGDQIEEKQTVFIAGQRVKVDFISESRTEFSGERFYGEGVVDRHEDNRIFGRLDDGRPFVCMLDDVESVL